MKNRRADQLRSRFDGRCIYQGSKVGASFKICSNNYECGDCSYYQGVIEPRSEILKDEKRKLAEGDSKKPARQCKYEGTSIGASFKLCTKDHQCDSCGHFQSVIEPHIDELVDENS